MLPRSPEQQRSDDWLELLLATLRTLTVAGTDDRAMLAAALEELLWSWGVHEPASEPSEPEPGTVRLEPEP